MNVSNMAPSDPSSGVNGNSQLINNVNEGGESMVRIIIEHKDTTKTLQDITFKDLWFDSASAHPEDNIVKLFLIDHPNKEKKD